jgi:hypothetical protein
MECSFREPENGITVAVTSTREPAMAVLDHHDFHVAPHKSENLQAAQFCLVWLAFFALIGVITYIASAL